MSADERFLALGDEIPPKIEVPEGLSFVTFRRSGRLVWLAGHGPNRVRRPPDFDFVGKVGRDLSQEQGYDAARLVGLNLLVTLRSEIDSLDAVGQIIHVVGAVNSAPGFYAQSYVLNGCTDLFTELFGDAGRPARMAFSAAELPFDMAIEASMVVELKP